MLNSGSFSRRFLALTIVGYILAVGGSMLAVRLASDGNLREMQDVAISEGAGAIAQAVEIALFEKAVRLEQLARQTEIVNNAIGDEVATDTAIDLIRTISDDGRLISVKIYDFLGEVTLDFLAEGRKKRFFDAEHSTAAQAVLSSDSREASYAYRPEGYETSARFLVTLPILRNGLVEGALVTEVVLDLGPVFQEMQMIGVSSLATQFQVDMARHWNDGVESVYTAHIEGSDFFVMLVPDRDEVTRLGHDIVRHAMLAVGVALVVPFGLMSFAGHRSIVAPHEALRKSREELCKNQRELRELANIARLLNDAIVTLDLEGQVTWANPAFTQSTGYELEEVLGKKPEKILHGPETDPDEPDRAHEAFRNFEPMQTEVLNYRKDGTCFWNSLSFSPLLDMAGTPYGFVSISKDVTNERNAHEEILQAKEEIEHRAFHDPLTGLPNRRALDEALEHANVQGARDRVLIRIDLDHFKNVNDTLGHAAGDFVLKEVSQILLDNIRAGDMAIRVGGDEFVILLAEGATRQNAVELSERVLSALDHDFSFEGKPCLVGASFGVAAAEDGLVGNSELLLGADAALYHAKDGGRGTIVTYGGDLHAQVIESRCLGLEIERALIEGEFEPFFQPQFCAKTLELKGVEALVRWRHPTRGIMAPGAFLKIAEQRAAIDRIDAMLCRKGLNEVSKLNKLGLFIPKVSFNVVARQLESPELLERVSRRDLGGTRVSFEVLESVLVEEQSAEFNFHIDNLKERGFGIEVDDFGSGHASIIGLMQLAPDTMKIDQRLVFPIVESEAARKMVQAILEIAKAVDISVTAEGVETANHASILSSLGCDTLQGYHFAKPMSAQDLELFLRSYVPRPEVLDRVVGL